MTPQVMRGTPASPGAAVGPAWTRPAAPLDRAAAARRRPRRRRPGAGSRSPPRSSAHLADALRGEGHGGDAEIVEANQLMAQDPTLLEAGRRNEALAGAARSGGDRTGDRAARPGAGRARRPAAGRAGGRPACDRPPRGRAEYGHDERAAGRRRRDRRRPRPGRGGGVERQPGGDRARRRRHDGPRRDRRPLAGHPARHRRRPGRAGRRRRRRARRRRRPGHGRGSGPTTTRARVCATGPRAWPSAPSATGASAASRPVTADGRTIRLLANAGTAAEVRAALDAGAEGIGLLRSELAFLDAPAWPTEEAARRGAAADARAARPPHRDRAHA